VQRQEYAKAFVQEKAIYKRNPESFSNIVNLAQLIIEEGEPETAEEIFIFILENNQDLDLQMTAHRYLMQIQIDKNLPENNEKILQELNTLIKKYGITPYSIDIQIQRAHFLAFYMGQSEEAIKAIQAAIELPLNTFQTAELKMLWADIMLYDEKSSGTKAYVNLAKSILK
jgi:tetratricopeptide (TPR) repeat protein